MRRKRGDRRAQTLRRRRDQDDIRARGEADIVGDLDVRFQLHAGQFWIDAGGGDLGRDGRAARAEHDLTSGARGNAGKRGAPCAGADHGD